MATQFPFSFVQDVFERVAARSHPPQWVVQEVQQRCVLFLNHVLMQEPQAMQRLTTQKGRIARIQWRHYFMALQVTPAGLLSLVQDGGATSSTPTAPDLHIEVTETSPLALAQAALRGDKPTIRIQGDIQLAEQINWLVENVRWEVEEDLARIVGDAWAHTMAHTARRIAQALGAFVGPRGSASERTLP